MNGRILIAEDDPKQAELIRLYLEREGHSVFVTGDGRSALEEVRRRQPDLVLLDVMMPRLDGLDVCRVLRYESDIPIIMLTARSTEDDLLLGLDLGADDYITKPFSPRELVARVRSVLRRGAVADKTPSELSAGRLKLDTVRHQVFIDKALIDVTPKEFAILAALIQAPGRAFTRRMLLEEAFGFDYDGLERTIDVHVANLRKKIERDPADPDLVQTVYGIGYKLNEGPYS
ncbi:MAG: response regulator transcription factor [Actinomycetia bacterium]|nr:response regulator transcription factor [Actinomycetes bacterium]